MMSNIFTSRNPASTAAFQLAGLSAGIAHLLNGAVAPLLSRPVPRHDGRYSVAEVSAFADAANRLLAEQNEALSAAAAAEADKALLLEAAAEQHEEARERILDLENALAAHMEELAAVRAQLANEQRERRRPAVSVSGAGVRPGF
jgi:hypothetical protein